ncbi:MAG: PTS sugar transporter subunit IIA [Candidatus Fermentibacteraceae bacterium]|nr:PTS sugar transporter subunit IIA [Candidatus Fermentibacteraceae bacterium]
MSCRSKRNKGCGAIDSFIPEITSSGIWEVIRELASSLEVAGFVSDPDTALSDLFYRERSISTGITQGLAIPHARTPRSPPAVLPSDYPERKSISTPSMEDSQGCSF